MILEGYTDEKDFIRFFGGRTIYKNRRTGRCCGVSAKVFSKGRVRCKGRDTQVHRNQGRIQKSDALYYEFLH